MIYSCPTWEFAAETHLLKLQLLQNKILRTIGNIPSGASVRDMHASFHILYVYDYMAGRQKSFKIMKMEMFMTLSKAKPDTENTRDLKVVMGMFMAVQAS
jgi:hypothetical protein